MKLLAIGGLPPITFLLAAESLGRCSRRFDAKSWMPVRGRVENQQFRTLNRVVAYTTFVCQRIPLISKKYQEGKLAQIIAFYAKSFSLRVPSGGRRTGRRPFRDSGVNYSYYFCTSRRNWKLVTHMHACQYLHCYYQQNSLLLIVINLRLHDDSGFYSAICYTRDARYRYTS